MPIFKRKRPTFSRCSKQERFVPSRLLLAIEGRALLEFATVPLAIPWLLKQVPRGQGHTVLVIPGFLASDASTVPLRGFLTSLGYNVSGWGQGRNLGPRAGMKEALVERLKHLQAESNGKISVVGWSLGGIFARETARAAPHLVEQVITLGSPLYGAPETSTHAWSLYNWLNGENEHGLSRGDEAPPVPTTSIYSRGDGIVGWRGSIECRGPHISNIEVNSASHLGLGVNPLVWRTLGHRLARSKPSAKPINRPAPKPLCPRFSLAACTALSRQIN